MFALKGIADRLVLAESQLPINSIDAHRQEHSKFFCSTIQYEYYFLEEIVDSDDQNKDTVTNDNRES
jgi:hypothetical protein